MSDAKFLTDRNKANYGIRDWIVNSAGIADFVNAMRTRQRTLRTENGLTTYHEYHTFEDIAYDDLVAIADKFGLIVAMSANEYMLAIPKLDYTYDTASIDQSTRLFLFIDRTSAGQTSIKFEGRYETVKETVNWMKQQYPFMASSLVSLYANGSNIGKKEYTLDSSDNRMPHDSFYPFLGDETLTQYYNRFIDSPNKVLILLGEKGMGKTTFIRGLMVHTKMKVGLCADATLMTAAPAKLFDTFAEEGTELNVFEDSDILLAPRRDMNFSMSTILNVADGLIPQRDVSKMIFTSNLSDESQIDDALTRHGRAFDIVRFDQYTVEQAEKVAADIGFDNFVGEQNKRYRLGDIVAMKNDAEHYTERSSHQYRRHVGFM